MENSDHLEVEENESNIGEQLMAKFLPYWPVFVLLLIVSVGAAYVYLRYTTPVFQAYAALIIKDDTRGGNEDSRISESLNLIAAKKNFENEIEVLKSRSLMEKIVYSLSLYAPVSNEGKIKSGDAYLTSPVVIEVQDPVNLKEVEKVYFTYDNKSRTVFIENKLRYPLNQFVSTPYGILKFKPNKYTVSARSSAKKPLYFSLQNPENVVLNYMGGLKISPNKQSAIVNITFMDPVPQRAVDVINQLIVIYDQVSINDKNILARKTLDFVNEQLSQISSELDSIEKNIQLYKSGKGAVDIGTQGTRYLDNVSENDQRVGDFKLQLTILDEVEHYVNNSQSGDILAPSIVGLKDPTLGPLLGQLQTVELEYGKLKKTVGKNNPSLVALEDQIGKLRPAIMENIKSQKSTLSASMESLNATNSGYNTMLSVVPEKEKKLLEISRQQLTKRDNYLFLLQKKQEAEMSVASVVSNSRVVDNAIATKFPVSPNKKMIYLIAIAGALGMGVGLIFVKDMLSGNIKYRNEIEKMTSVRILSEITYEKSKNPLVIVKGARTFVAEEFRKLRMSLTFLGIDSAHKKLLITSSISGEGKSFIAANLAASISLVGKRVILVDCDLNQPTLSDILDVDYEEGVSEYLLGNKEPVEIINKLESYENLYFISAGALTDNPSELMANGRIKHLIQYLDENFDMVIIDTSPSVLVTDAFLLSGMCDATLYVIRHGFTPKILVRRIDANAQINPLKNPAIVFNGLKTRGVFKNSYGYGYNYVYGNKYGNQGDKKRRKKAS